MAWKCKVCNSEFGLFSTMGCITVSDGRVCKTCWLKAGLDTSGNTLISARNYYSSNMIKNLIIERKKSELLINQFKETRVYGDLRIDDENKLIKIQNLNKHTAVYKFAQILDFELIENGGVVTKGGVSNALIGGALFGITGAIVGAAATGSNSECTSLRIKITLKDSNVSAEYLDYIRTATAKNSSTYNNLFKLAQDVLSVLQNIIDESNDKSPKSNNVNNNFSVADEILKFKQLLDQGIITQEEFEAKKKELLDLK